MNGAQPSDTVKAMLSHRGIMLKKHLQIGVIKGAITQDQADSKLESWLKDKSAKTDAKASKASANKEADAKPARRLKQKFVKHVLKRSAEATSGCGSR